MKSGATTGPHEDFFRNLPQVPCLTWKRLHRKQVKAKYVITWYRIYHGDIDSKNMDEKETAMQFNTPSLFDYLISGLIPGTPLI